MLLYTIVVDDIMVGAENAVGNINCKLMLLWQMQIIICKLNECKQETRKQNTQTKQESKEAEHESIYARWAIHEAISSFFPSFLPFLKSFPTTYNHS